MGHEMGLWVDLILDKTIRIIKKFYTETKHTYLAGSEKQHNHKLSSSSNFKVQVWKILAPLGLKL